MTPNTRDWVWTCNRCRPPERGYSQNRDVAFQGLLLHTRVRHGRDEQPQGDVRRMTRGTPR